MLEGEIKSCPIRDVAGNHFSGDRRTVQVIDPRIVSKAEAATAGDVRRILYRVHPYDEAALVVTAR